MEGTLLCVPCGERFEGVWNDDPTCYHCSGTLVLEPALCECHITGPPAWAKGILRDSFTRSPLTGYWVHCCGKPKRAWWQGQALRIASSPPDP